MSKSRTFSICLTDLPKNKMTKHNNGKVYINLSSWDNDERDEFGNDFSVSVPLSKAEVARKKAGEPIERIFVGNGKIWEQATVKENEDPMGLDSIKAEPKDEEKEDHFV